jgi:hypothetical protein
MLGNFLRHHPSALPAYRRVVPLLVGGALRELGRTLAKIRARP